MNRCLIHSRPLVALLVLYSLGTANGASAYEQGVKLFEQGRWFDAMTAFSTAIRLDPQNADGYRKRSSALLNLGRFDESYADANRAIQLAPRSAKGYAMRGSAEMRLHKFKEALADSEQCLAIDQECADCYALRGMVLVNMGSRYDDAVTNLTQAISRGYRTPIVFGFRGIAHIHLKNYQKAVDDETACLKTGRSTAALGNRAFAFLHLKNYDRALADATEAIRSFSRRMPNDWEGETEHLRSETYNTRGCALAAKGDYVKAMADFDEAIRIEPRNVDARNNRDLVAGKSR